MSRPRLTLAEIDAFDPTGPPNRKWCPLCGGDKPRDGAHRCLSIDRESGLWNCFRCAAAGKAGEFYDAKPRANRDFERRKLQHNFSLGENPFVDERLAPNSFVDEAKEPDSFVDERLAPQLFVDEAKESNSFVDERNATIAAEKPKFDWRAAWGNAPNIENTAGERYLRSRAISLDAMVWAQLRFCANWSGASVVFPIHNRSGELVAAQGRAIRGNAKRTHGPKKEGAFFAPVELANRVFGPLDARTPVIVLVEAPIDALSIASCGFPALALCGTSGPSWLHIACGLRRVALAFDADDAGERAAQEIGARLSPFGARCERAAPQGFKDWNEWLQADSSGLTEFLESCWL